MLRSTLVAPAAFLWGLVVFFPVGVPYAAAVLLLLALLASPDRRERWQRVRSSALFWPVTAFVAWTLVVLALRPHYPETGSNLFHALRIAATVWMAMALTRREAQWALRGFLLMCAINFVLIASFYTFYWPFWTPWRGVLLLVGNKSISNALLFTMLAASAAVVALDELPRHRSGRVLAAIGVVMAVVAIITLSLPSRTSLLGLLVAFVAICVHRWRRQLRRLAVVLVAGAAVAAVLLPQAGFVQKKFELGVQELEQAQAGGVSEGSWVVRYYMYRDTARMIEDRPFMGWGIGGWTSQWHLRGPKLLADYNMPHNDLLWMGSQAGVPGALTLLAIFLVALWQAWRIETSAGRHAFAAVLLVLIALNANSALRDAQIGLSILWIAMVQLQFARMGARDWEGLLRRHPPQDQSGPTPPPRVPGAA